MTPGLAIMSSPPNTPARSYLQAPIPLRGQYLQSQLPCGSWNGQSTAHPPGARAGNIRLDYWTESVFPPCAPAEFRAAPAAHSCRSEPQAPAASCHFLRRYTAVQKLMVFFVKMCYNFSWDTRSPNRFPLPLPVFRTDRGISFFSPHFLALPPVDSANLGTHLPESVCSRQCAQPGSRQVASSGKSSGG